MSVFIEASKNLNFRFLHNKAPKKFKNHRRIYCSWSTDLTFKTFKQIIHLVEQSLEIRRLILIRAATIYCSESNASSIDSHTISQFSAIQLRLLQQMTVLFLLTSHLIQNCDKMCIQGSHCVQWHKKNLLIYFSRTLQSVVTY